MTTVREYLCLLVIACLVFAVAVAGASVEDETAEVCYEKGKALYDEREYKEAYRWIASAAENGHIPAQTRLGFMYYSGRGVQQSIVEAVDWFRKAAEQGGVHAQRNLGIMYDNGDGVEESWVEAVKWYRRAAGQGDVPAQCNLGTMYENGRGTEKDYTEAVRWYRSAAEEGNAAAQCNLGIMYENGRGIEKDYPKAVGWYRKAAEMDNALSQYNLGRMYEHGRGVGRDHDQAVGWYRKAAEMGNALAQFYLGYICNYGKGVEKDSEEAIKWYRKAAVQGNAKSQYNLGLMYHDKYDSDGVEEDYAAAVKWYRMAAEQGNAKAQYNLANMNKLELWPNMHHWEAVEALRSELTITRVDTVYPQQYGKPYWIKYGSVQKPRSWSTGPATCFGHHADFMDIIFMQACNDREDLPILMKGYRLWVHLPTDSVWNAFSDSLYTYYGSPVASEESLTWPWQGGTVLLARHSDSSINGVREGYYILQSWGPELSSIRAEQGRQQRAEIEKSRWKK